MSKMYTITSSQGWLTKAILYGLLVIMTVFYLLPLWGALTTSLKTDTEIDTTNPLTLPRDPTSKGYIDAYEYLRRSLLNSLINDTLWDVRSGLAGSDVRLCTIQVSL